jgi:hypothetical protein
MKLLTPMSKAGFRKRSIAVLLTTLAAAGAIAASTTETASADQGGTIVGNFCLSGPGGHPFCISAGLDGQTPVEGYGVDGNGGICHTPPATDGPPPGGPKYCVPSGTGLLTIRPGTYTITVDDPLDSHNFELRSCPGSTAPCGPGQGAEQELTPVCNDDPANSDVFKCGTNTENAANEIVKTVQIFLKPGTYRLFCDAQQPVVHEAAGMYVDIKVDLVGANLNGQNLPGVDYSGADAANASVNGSNLQGAVLANVDLQGASVDGSNLQGADLTNANLQGANVSGSNLDGADLTGANLPGANLQGSNLNGADLTGANLTGAHVQGANLNNVVWSHTTCPDGTSSDSHGGSCAGH